MSPTIITVIAIAIILIVVPLHIYFVAIPEAKERASHGGMAANAYREHMKEQGCYETMLGWRCLP